MNKKGMDQQIFTYIFAMIVLGLIIFFGIKMIKGVGDTAHAVENVKFKKDIDNQVQKIYSYSPGSKANLEIKGVPNGIKAVCFIDLTTPVNLNEIPYDDVKLFAEGKKGTRTNVFFAATTKQSKTPDPTTVSKLKPTPNPLCIDITTSGNLGAKLENEGAFIKISS